MKNIANQGLSASYSVVIPSCGRPKMLEKALGSVACQTVPPQKVFLVIDEPIGENNYEFLSHTILNLKIKYTGGGLGGAAARNVGLGQVTDESYIFFLDDDDEWYSEKIERQIMHMEENVSDIGITCWNRNTADETMNVKRASKTIINSYLPIWNTLGSFSFFGYRVTPETKTIRLCESLRAAQDWEFYIQLSRFGQFAVVEEYLARYYEHDEIRITGNAKVKALAWKKIYQKYRHQLSARQRWLHLARISWKKSEINLSVLRVSCYSFLAIVLSIAAFQRVYSFKVITAATSSLLRRVGLKKS